MQVVKFALFINLVDDARDLATALDRAARVLVELEHASLRSFDLSAADVLLAQVVQLRVHLHELYVELLDQVPVRLRIQHLLHRQDQAQASLVENINSLPVVLKRRQLLVQLGDALLNFDMLRDVPVNDENFESFLELSVAELEEHCAVAEVPDLFDLGPLEVDFWEHNSLFLAEGHAEVVQRHEALDEVSHQR